MRKEIILQIVGDLSSSGQTTGVTAEEVAAAAGVQRHNASGDLNELVREGLLTKGEGRPVRFSLVLDPGIERSLVYTTINPPVATQDSAFDSFIGAQGGLRTAVEQAKAAMVYPPRGLPTLIVGPTGTGKSFLAERMYHYAKHVGRLDANAPFNVFNCADYASNPQLLLAQLFGYIKGAFTGADKTMSGLVAQSDNGVLFLDEIHRLPPEGQEMLFMLMDKGIYRMLGDGVAQRKASITLIAATSEDPHSVLLKTLLRRFPAVIKLPELDQRPMEERLALIEYFLQEESTRLGIPISVSPFVLVALLIFRTEGNVGELQSSILLSCAKAFLNIVATGKSMDTMPLTITHLAPQIQLEYLRNQEETLSSEQLVGLEDRIYMPLSGRFQQADKDLGKAAMLYEQLRHRVCGYLESGLAPNEIQQLVQIDSDYYLRRLVTRVGGSAPFPSHFLNAVSGFIEEAGKELGYKFEQEVTTGITLHLASLKRSDAVNAEQMLTLMTHCTREYGVVLRLAPMLEEALDLKLTTAELGFVALFLASHTRKGDTGQIKVMVIAHGNHTASSMAEVANTLLVDKRVTAIDMPLNQSVEDTLQLAVDCVREMGNIEGLLLLVDMGSLTGFGVALEKSTGVPVSVIPFVTTAAVIEAGRLVGSRHTDLSQIVQTVKQIYQVETVFPPPQEGKRIIITTCLTGHGTARKLAAFINEALPAAIRSDVLVQPVDLQNGSNITGLLVEGWRGSVIAAVGTVDPNLPGVAFFGMEQLLFGNGVQALIELAADGQSALTETASALSKEEAITLARRFVADQIHDQHGSIYAEAAIGSLKRLEPKLGKSLSAGHAVRWVIHLAFALERIREEGPIMECDDMAFLESQHAPLLASIEQSLAPALEELSITLPRGETGCLALILLSE
jgi:transcriptional regulatory protein LevR/transcriptional regulator with AAA-type ATPase domain